MFNISSSLVAAGLTLAALLIPQSAPTKAQDRAQDTVALDTRQPCNCAPAGPAAPKQTPEAHWTLTWDDTVNETLDRTDKRCQIALSTVDSTVTGRFRGPVMGKERRAVFTGEVAQGGALLILQQREAGYVCSYQFTAAHKGWKGTWRDSRGRSGTAILGSQPKILNL